MKIAKTAVWIIIFYILQTCIAPYMRIYGAVPELLFVFAVCVAYFEKEPICYSAVGVVCGLIAGTVYGTNPVFYLISYIATVLLVSSCAEIMYSKPLLLIMPFVFIMTFACGSIFFFVSKEYLGQITYASAFMSVILPVTIYNTAVSLLIGLLVKKTVCR